MKNYSKARNIRPLLFDERLCSFNGNITWLESTTVSRAWIAFLADLSIFKDHKTRPFEAVKIKSAYSPSAQQ